MDEGNDPIAWPPCCHDITPLDILLWSCVKDMVHRTKVQGIIDLQHRISEAITTVTIDMVARTWQKLNPDWIFFVGMMAPTESCSIKSEKT